MKTLSLLSRVTVLAVSSLLVPGSAFAAAELFLTKSGPGSARPGETIVYTIQVSNGGLADPVPDARVEDPTPPGLDFDSITGVACTQFPCDLPPMAPGAFVSFTATYKVQATYIGPDIITNTATVTSSLADGNPTDNTATASTALVRVQGFYTLPPCRVADTRGASGVPIGGPALDAGEARTFNIRERCGLPGNAIGVSYNITVTQPTSEGDLRFYPLGEMSLASAINYVSGQTRANNGIVKIPSNGSVVAQCDQGSGSVHFILDVNGYFTASDEVPTPAGLSVRIRPAPEVEITFDNVTTGGSTSARVIQFVDDRTTPTNKNLQDFFPAGSPERILLPNVTIPDYVQAMGQGGPSGPPTFMLAIIDTDAKFSRTAEFHGLEDFRLGWDPPCVNADPALEPRTFYAREAPKNEPPLEEESSTFEGPVFVDISSGCGSNKGSGWNFSLYLTGRDARPPLDIAREKLTFMSRVLSSFGAFITNATVAGQLLTEVQAALATLDGNPASSFANVNNWIALVDNNPSAFNNAVRNVSGELVGRAQSARYMILKLLQTRPLTEFPVSTFGFGYGVTGGPDANVWFAAFNEVGRITPAGQVTMFPMPAGPEVTDITTGPDGNLWVTSHQRIIRVTPTGSYTEFPLPNGSSDANLITAGGDGNLWFTTFTTIGRITTSGVVTHFPLPPAGGNRAFGIAAGPDGNVWFTGQDGNVIGRVTPAGVITEFTIPTVGSIPMRIAAGPDGNLWFTESNLVPGKIGRITTAGVITEFPLPPGPGGCFKTPMGIAAGPDGNLWFVEQAPCGNKVGRITPSGAITEFGLPEDGFPRNSTAIARGPDGNLWFTEMPSNGHKLGRISP